MYVQGTTQRPTGTLLFVGFTNSPITSRKTGGYHVLIHDWEVDYVCCFYPYILGGINPWMVGRHDSLRPNDMCGYMDQYTLDVLP